MQELWSMLHFLMPELFSNSEDFNEWFALSTEVDANKKLRDGQKASFGAKAIYVAQSKSRPSCQTPR